MNTKKILTAIAVGLSLLAAPSNAQQKMSPKEVVDAARSVSTKTDAETTVKTWLTIRDAINSMPLDQIAVTVSQAEIPWYANAETFGDLRALVLIAVVERVALDILERYASKGMDPDKEELLNRYGPVFRSHTPMWRYLAWIVPNAFLFAGDYERQENNPPAVSQRLNRIAILCRIIDRERMFE